MFQKRNIPLFVVMLAVLVMFMPYQNYDPPLVSTAGEQGDLVKELTGILQADPRLDGALAGVSVRSAESGELIFEHLADTRLKPASNMKLLTAAAALETLGKDYTFTTEVLAAGEVKGNKLHGSLILKGKGDPTLMEEDFQEMAASLKEAGIREVKGSVIADDSWYDDERLSEDISWNDEDNYYASQISALSVSPNEDYDAGTVIVAAYPADEKGKKARIEVTPSTDYVKVINRTKTVSLDEPKDISIHREHGTNEIIVEGEIPLEGSRARSWVAVWEPTGLALDLFKKALEEEGIKVKDQDRFQNYRDDPGIIARHESMPLEELMIPFMKLSNNTHAEVLIKEMGKVVHGEGDFDKGLEVVQSFLEENDINAEGMRLRDGSGMSHVNMISANALSKLLYMAQGEEWFPVYLESLPVAGNSERFVGGTLRHRMQGTAAEENVKAKTGSLTGVTSLSGYVTNTTGEPLIFSIVLNNYVVDDLQEVEDQIAIVLADSKWKN
ncbi:D-alanyl-D-alanine carboxypeptidase/D-alanyl-D-alanine-endopeptidase [Thalassobacillus pellis]|uniref:D-alanyl-D-alanine carboxypeptidase/D-alanyl-D-alanine endopeptidase n=1 Tax=Thalassobacillus pellis TaxID=748008 RepID=UPI0019602904|nr:D-alanyl-D-alanine carboxypeptidase/D-alanyl-D-alanine-endopeptidase [Thalassobacillus pellis]MBM7553787.1 D-alanyl-D-alanine carboxypeptidase/D-alanyl-D-alanine-endopeptidase (penicillin-binding protein 4) [Thalassobacillus pellis]